MSLEEVDWKQLPQPLDDGSANHLAGLQMPSIVLPTTDKHNVNLAELKGLTVVYIYPMTGRPDTPPPDGWDTIPGARGCTPQSCAFRDHMQELTELGVNQLFGLSTQNTDYQSEAADRLHLPYALLSDSELRLQQALQLPTMKVHNQTLLKRLTMIINDGNIVHTFYPVFPPDKNVSDVIQWLSENRP